MTNRCGTGSSKHLKLHVWYFWSYSCSQSVKYAKSQIVLKVFRRVLTFPPMGQAGWCSLSRRGYGFVLVGEAWSVIFICPFKFSYCYQLVLPCLNSCLPGRSKSNLSTAFWRHRIFLSFVTIGGFCVFSECSDRLFSVAPKAYMHKFRLPPDTCNLVY